VSGGVQDAAEGVVGAGGLGDVDAVHDDGLPEPRSR
jgi:hypothetical protein